MSMNRDGHAMEMHFSKGRPWAMTSTWQRGVHHWAGNDLHFAASEGCAEKVSALLLSGMSLFLKDEFGFMPIHYAALRGHVTILEKLLAAMNISSERTPSADIENYPNEMELTPLHIACRERHIEAVDLLLRHGFNPNYASVQGWTPSHMASVAGSIELLQKLQEYGGDIYKCTPEGWSVLHISSVYVLHEPLIEWLVGQNIDPSLRNAHGVTPMHIAAHHNNYGAMSVLLRLGASPHIKCLCNDHNTAFEEAVGRSGANASTLKIFYQHDLQLEDTLRQYFFDDSSDGFYAHVLCEFEKVKKDVEKVGEGLVVEE